jgi:hypothetical protein
MSKPSKKKIEKKKEHQKEDYKKLIKRKENLMQTAKKEKADWRLERDTRQKIVPIRKEHEIHAKSAAEIANQIELNLQQLKDMEAEYEKASNERDGFNESLEAEGFTTIKEKLDFLNKQAEEQAMKNSEEKFEEKEEKSTI